MLYYESHGGGSGLKYTAPADEKYIEAVVNRILLNRDCGGGILPNAISFNHISKQARHTEDMIVDDIETLGPDGFDAITDALAMFRKKQ